MCKQERKYHQLFMEELSVPEYWSSRHVFQHFEVLLYLGAVGAGEGVVLMPLKVSSQDADVIPQHNFA